MKILFCLSGLSLAFIIFQLIFPYKPHKQSLYPETERNSDKFKRMEKLTVLWIFPSIGFICYCVFLFGSQLHEIFYSSDYEYVITAPKTFWILPGIILGFGLTRIPMTFIYKLVLKNNYDFYVKYTNLKLGFNPDIIWKPIEWILIIGGIIVFVLGLNWFVRIDSSGKIEINELLSIKQETYGISEIAEIYHYDNYVTETGNIKKLDHFVIKMGNGYSLSSHIYSFFASENDKKKIKEMIEKISKITGKDIKNAKQPDSPASPNKFR